jgi:hypothetical protein
MLITLQAEKKLNIRAAIILFSASAFCVVLLLFVGWGGKVLNRATSGIEVLFSKASTGKPDDVDTFGGRLALAQERFLASARNNTLRICHPEPFGYTQDKLRERSCQTEPSA